MINATRWLRCLTWEVEFRTGNLYESRTKLRPPNARSSATTVSARKSPNAREGSFTPNWYTSHPESTTPVIGSLQKEMQRVAWTMDGKPNTVFETGLYNLTQDETTMLVHFGTDRTEQYRLFRVQQEGEDSSSTAIQ